MTAISMSGQGTLDRLRGVLRPSQPLRQSRGEAADKAIESVVTKVAGEFRKKRILQPTDDEIRTVLKPHLDGLPCPANVFDMVRLRIGTVNGRMIAGSPDPLDTESTRKLHGSVLVRAHRGGSSRRRK